MKKLQLHIDLKKERDRIAYSPKHKPDNKSKAAGESLGYQFLDEKLKANYEAMKSLAKVFQPLGGKLALLEQELPSPQELLPPASPGRIRVKIKE